MRKPVAIKNQQGLITTVYLTDDENIISKEKLIDHDEYVRGVGQLYYQKDVVKEMGDNYVSIGTQAEKLKNGYLFRVFFIKKGEFEERKANDIIQEWMENWQEEFGGYNSQSQAKRINIQKGKKIKTL